MLHLLKESRALLNQPNKWPVLLSFLPWVLIFLFLVYQSWFLCDDAFISFRYVRNLINGNGLVFNEGEYVEGYTNFLWVLKLAAIWKFLGVRPEVASLFLSSLLTLGTIVSMLSMRSLSLRKNLWLLSWMATGLLLCSTTFAVWNDPYSRLGPDRDSHWHLNRGVDVVVAHPIFCVVHDKH